MSQPSVLRTRNSALGPSYLAPPLARGGVRADTCYLHDTWKAIFVNRSARLCLLCPPRWDLSEQQLVHSKTNLPDITGRANEDTLCNISAHTHSHPSILTASIHHTHPLNTPLLPPSSPLFHFPTSNCSAGFSSFKFIAFHFFHLLSESLDIYLCTVLALITCSTLPAPSCVCALQSMRWDEMALTAETQPPIYL